MLDTIRLIWGRWPTLLRRSAAGSLTVLLLALVYLLLAGTPQPIPPASSLFATVSVESALADSRPALSSSDFSLRPVFAIRRMPPAPQPVTDEEEKASVEAAPQDEIVGSIDGVSLLGIFGSGEVAGVIIRLDNGERQRLPVGESVKGWTLQSLGTRRAMLQAATGRRAVLEMAFATDQDPADVMAASASKAAASSPSGGEVEPSQQDSTTDAADTAPKRITFENVYGGANKPGPDEQE